MKRSSFLYNLLLGAGLVVQANAAQAQKPASTQAPFEVSLAGDGIVDRFKQCLYENGVIPEQAWPEVKSGRYISGIASIPYDIARSCAAKAHRLE